MELKNSPAEKHIGSHGSQILIKYTCPWLRCSKRLKINWNATLTSFANGCISGEMRDLACSTITLFKYQPASAGLKKEYGS